MTSLARILIIDYGSQTTEVIARALREEGYRSGILDPAKAVDWFRSGNQTDAIILSGGDKSVYAEGAPGLPAEVLAARHPNGGPIPNPRDLLWPSVTCTCAWRKSRSRRSRAWAFRNWNGYTRLGVVFEHSVRPGCLVKSWRFGCCSSARFPKNSLLNPDVAYRGDGIRRRPLFWGSIPP